MQATTIAAGTHVYVWFLVESNPKTHRVTKPVPFKGLVVSAKREIHVGFKGWVCSIAYDDSTFESNRHLHDDEENKCNEGSWTLAHTNNPVGPIFPSNKSHDLQHILPYVPLQEGFDTYVEPFIGSGTMLFSIGHRAKHRFINDTNQNMCNIYKCIAQGKSQELCNAAQSNKRPHDAMIESGAAFIKKKCKNTSLETILARLQDQDYADLLATTNITSVDFGDVMMAHHNKPSCFVFLDPPTNSTFFEADHCRLMNAIRKSRAKCMVVVPKTPMTEKVYDEHIKHTYKSSHKAAEHLIVCNY